MSRRFRTAMLGAAAAALVLPLAAPAAAQSARPDLNANMTISPATWPPNKLQVKTVIGNRGLGIANLNQKRPNGTVIHMVRWFVKKNGTGTDKFVLAMSMLGKLGPHQKKILNSNITIPADFKPGQHVLCVVVDPENKVRESNEGNNRTCQRFVAKPRRMIIAKPGLKGPIVKPRPGPGPGLKPIKPRGCAIDLAVAEFQVGILYRNPGHRFSGRIQAKAVLKNVGSADYVTRPNQQTVQIYHGSRLLTNAPFGNLRAGQVEIITAQLPWNAAEEFQQGLKALIAYDPDIRLDGNPRNDDCNMGNNQKTVAPARINRLFTG